jgi:hypothetical protein
MLTRVLISRVVLGYIRTHCLKAEHCEIDGSPWGDVVDLNGVIDVEGWTACRVEEFNLVRGGLCGCVMY